MIIVSFGQQTIAEAWTDPMNAITDRGTMLLR